MHPQLIHTHLTTEQADLIISTGWFREWYWLVNGSIMVVGLYYGDEIRAGSMSVEDAKLTMPDHLKGVRVEKRTREWDNTVLEWET